MRRSVVGLLIAVGTTMPMLVALVPGGAVLVLVLFAVVAAAAAGLAAYLALTAPACTPAEPAEPPVHIEKSLHVHDVPV